MMPLSKHSRSWLSVLVACCLLLLSTKTSLALKNGLALKPPMGYNTWNAFHGDINEDLVKHTADLMVDLKLKAAGYEYLVMDGKGLAAVVAHALLNIRAKGQSRQLPADAWANKDRGPNGKVEGNFDRFASGIKSVADYTHGKGLTLYSDSMAHHAWTCNCVL